MKNKQEGTDDFIIGRHPAIAALKSTDQEINKVFLQSGLRAGAIGEIIKLAKKRHLVVTNVPKAKLDRLVNHENHQGVVLAVAAYQYATIDDLFERAAQRDESPFFVILDQLADPHNLGSILRTADAAGVHGVIIPKRRSVGLTSVVAKTAAGALEHVPVARVNNLVQAAEELKERGVWLFGTDMKGTDYRRWDAKGASAVVIGNEGKGISPLMKKTCDEMLTIPMVGHVQSLNASVAASLLIYQGFSSRHPLD
ncbi:MAG: 23S rRNA (guanosine(2251)-2'-O)-methyltransferase RlmB [[Lactobacillus] timonensis]|jgi:23S rRNA (guanosine2251-2'-O)-methyltransferase|uniref:23S rRNA (guanosine(2251)-2'-O)-methyltransferase RlmB n=1 Tax=[Lactobacillus] timonensis TaxID=1970790 RepID=UPI000C860EFB|nr:23S rRNA (guanosine(2251)-2'-O)-methyltransferase RlmB [[Lactobacillus] timonensis]MCI1926050.1 23S rRNA (guanosine(2251)-2'-O)-methyltransferase RlmB [[Lactobacillus] timonensis]MCI1957450.1 23S rRNA (guanosine(2251)-2'-O)-methyltransferase RlmB [[Lactobacillus] timonensis]MCI1970400.1 23S rRNA (guanosine(2251)-2'-O)-methyltransferase RlmB [[Lactobacillus] timonensis]MCI2006644.1 23S rRNA (guanosine(2251)-2'-O)-methyltransferase RlmB [[Lactobacillus] timonensis]